MTTDSNLETALNLKFIEDCKYTIEKLEAENKELLYRGDKYRNQFEVELARSEKRLEQVESLEKERDELKAEVEDLKFKLLDRTEKYTIAMDKGVLELGDKRDQWRTEAMKLREGLMKVPGKGTAIAVEYIEAFDEFVKRTEGK